MGCKSQYFTQKMQIFVCEIYVLVKIVIFNSRFLSSAPSYGLLLKSEFPLDPETTAHLKINLIGVEILPRIELK